MNEAAGLSEAEILAALDPEQAAAALTLTGPTCIIAGAGSGKTRTISHRIALGIAKGAFTPNRILALTYTNRAANELRIRLKALGAGAVTVRTFHAAALAQLQFFWPQLTGERPPKLLPSKYKLISEITTSKKIQLDEAALREVASEIEWRKYSMLSLEDYAKLERTAAGLSSQVLLDLFREYEAQKLSKKVVDWEDILLLCLGMLEAEPRILAHVQSQYRFFTVDEYQDISPLQQALLEIWLGDRSELCVVGDPRQTIYSFAGAASKFLTSFDARYPNAEIIELNRNYRSSAEIVAVANKVLEAQPLSAQRGERGKVAVNFFDTESQELSYLAKSISELVDAGKPAKEIAVLTRMNYQLESVERALIEVGLPVALKGSGRFFQKPEVIQVSAAIRALAMKSEREPLFIELSNILSGMGWTSKPQTGAKWESLNWFIEILEQLGETAELDEYLRELDERTRSLQEPERNAVTLATVHSAKGLEWDAVFLPTMNQGVFPNNRAETASALEEERRLFYVAVTRAKTDLRISALTTKDRSEFLSVLV